VINSGVDSLTDGNKFSDDMNKWPPRGNIIPSMATVRNVGIQQKGKICLQRATNDQEPNAYSEQKTKPTLSSDNEVQIWISLQKLRA
jgi:hypothetical protein